MLVVIGEGALKTARSRDFRFVMRATDKLASKMMLMITTLKYLPTKKRNVQEKVNSMTASDALEGGLSHSGDYTTVPLFCHLSRVSYP